MKNFTIEGFFQQIGYHLIVMMMIASLFFSPKEESRWWVYAIILAAILFGIWMWRESSIMIQKLRAKGKTCHTFFNNSLKDLMRKGLGG